MITVSISINGNPILTRSAMNIRELKDTTTEEDKPICEYEMDDGNRVLHSPTNGAVELAKQMLDKIDKNFVKRSNSVQENKNG